MDRVSKYALDVLEGREIAGRYVKLACQRHLDDIEKSKLAPYKYEFNEELAQENIDFFESLRFTDGEIAGQPVKLFGFQDFIVGSQFGWVIKGTKYRRFRKSYIQLARKNAKSLIESGTAIKLAGFDDYPNAQVYCTATKMKQARIVWEQASKFIDIEPDLRELFKIKDHDAIIECLLNGGKIMALGRDTGTIDGFDPHGGVIDEYHGHKTNQMVKLLEDGSVMQTNSLISIITTAGFDLNSPCYTEYEYCCKVLEGIEPADQYFIFIAQMDKDDDIWDPKNWPKANPLVSKFPERFDNLKRFAAEAKAKGGEDLRDFITKSLNTWYEYTNNGYLDVVKWKNCGCDLTLEDFRGQKCILGLDLSKGGDLTSGVLEFEYQEIRKVEGKNEIVPMYFFEQHSFLPEKKLAMHIKTDKAPYDVWVNQGLITLTKTLGGWKTDYKYILQYYKDIIKKYDLKLIAIAYDPHNADAFLSDLAEFGVDCIEIFQTPKYLNTPTDDFRNSVDSDQVRYNKNDGLMRWTGAYAIITSNAYGEIKIDKEHKDTERIDTIAAAIDAHKVVILNRDTKVDVNKYATDDFLTKLWG